MRVARKSRRTRPFDKGILPPRQKKVMEAYYPANDPWLQKQIIEGELTVEEVEAIGEVRARENMFQKRTKTFHERAKNIEKEAFRTKRAMEEETKKQSMGRRRSQYLGKPTTAAQQFERLAKSKEGHEMEALEKEAQEPSLPPVLVEDIQEPMASIDVAIEMIPAKPKKKKEEKVQKTGPLSKMRNEWSEDVNASEQDLLSKSSDKDFAKMTKKELLQYAKSQGWTMKASTKDTKKKIVAEVKQYYYQQTSKTKSVELI